MTSNTSTKPTATVTDPGNRGTCRLDDARFMARLAASVGPTPEQVILGAALFARLGVALPPAVKKRLTAGAAGGKAK